MARNYYWSAGVSQPHLFPFAGVLDGNKADKTALAMVQCGGRGNLTSPPQDGGARWCMVSLPLLTATYWQICTPAFLVGVGAILMLWLGGVRCSLPPRLDRPLAALLATAAISTMLAANPDRGLLPLLWLAATAMGFAWAWNRPPQEAANAVLLVVAVVVFEGIIRLAARAAGCPDWWLTPAGFGYGWRLTTRAGDWMLMSPLLLSAISLLPTTRFSSHRGVSCTLRGMMVVGLLVTLLFTGSRSSWLCGTAAAVLTIRSLRGAAVVAACCGVFLALLPHVSPLLLADRGIADATGAIDAGRFVAHSSGRGEFWPLALDIWRANPLLGAGLGGYWFVSQGSAGYTTFHPHNQVLYVLAEQGIIGLLAWGWLAWELRSHGRLLLPIAGFCLLNSLVWSGPLTVLVAVAASRQKTDG